MTPKEIEKAAEEYARRSIDETTEIPNCIEQIRAFAVTDFMEGAEFVNKHWQEKTRWIPIEERLPPRGTETRQVFVKNKNKHHLNWMIVSCFDDDYLEDIEFIKGEFTHWKEIE